MEKEQNNIRDSESEIISDTAESDISESEDTEEEKKNEKPKQKVNEFDRFKDKGYGDYLQQNQDTDLKPPIVVVVQGPKKVSARRIALLVPFFRPRSES